MGMIAFVRDGLFGLRVLRKKPVFFTVVLLTLAVSIGATTAIFSVVNSILLHPLPYDEADRLVVVWQTNAELLKESGLKVTPVSYGDFSDLKENHPAFEQVAALDTWFANLTGVEEPERLYGVRASATFFNLMRVQPLFGRTFLPEDEQPNANRVVLLSHDFWLRQFGRDRGVIGRQLVLNDYPFTVVGVLPQDFRFTEASNLSSFKFSERTDVWAPLIIGDRRNNRGFHNLAVIGRLKPGASVEQADLEVQVLGQRTAQQYPGSNAGYGMKAISLKDQVTSDLKPVLLTILAATGFVLLIACADLAILLMARAATRQGELAVRMALGASRGRLLRQLLAESVFLSLLGGGVGVLVAYVSTFLLIGFSPQEILQNNPVRIDLRVLGFTFAVSLLTGLLFGILPAYQGVKADFTEDLKLGARGTARRLRSTLQALIVAEVALTIVLMVGAGLAVKSFIYLLNVNPGFDPNRVVAMDVYLPASRYKESAQGVQLFQQTMEKIKELPGVESVGMNYALPFSGVNPTNTFEVEGQPQLKPGDFQSANLGISNPEYFRTLGIPLLRGRYFTEQDTSTSQPVAIVDERMVNQFFPNEDPIGKRISIASKQPLSIVGVVGTIKHDVFEPSPHPYVYLPYQQRNYSYTSFVVRSKTEDPARLIPSVREAIRTLDGNLPIANVRTLQHSYSEAIAPRRYSMLLLIIFGSIALLLTEMGIYGVIHYAVEQRRREIGIRMALGAQPREVFRIFMKQGLASLLIGLSAGLLLSMGLAKLMMSLIYGISPWDVPTFSSILIITAGATFLASYLPARKATKVNPTEILRAE
jgi:putative ABC transport system permease protein